ncbi:PucR family transcriptional regulator [Nocardioides alcanivorans]|uniref:PucR family transcriptional regulator n=1 Tax=Nocardioides alcanivorans TaxID=2897352 RepID=UPI001F322925|nr:helix-turn-helix domain-containing protein [Nocardioides alcanivorans]
MLIGLRNGDGPTAEALEHAAAIGRDRARFGIPLVDAIEGYHVAAAEIWGYLFSRASERGPAWIAELSSAVAPLWAVVNRTSTSFTTAHAAETARLAAGQHQVRSRLVALLGGNSPNSGLVTALFDQLGFDAQGSLTVLLTGQATPPVMEALQEQLGTLDGVAHCALDPEARILLIGQDIDLQNLAEMTRDLTDLRVGVGLTRTGAQGAAMSLTDAGLALAAATRAQPVVRFSSDWLTAIFTSEAHRLEPLLRSSIDTAGAHPHLADAVTAFAAHRFSLTAAAQALHVHPNTAKYRLARWEELTGWDALTGDGLIRSLIAIRLSAQD